MMEKVEFGCYWWPGVAKCDQMLPGGKMMLPGGDQVLPGGDQVFPGVPRYDQVLYTVVGG